MYITMYVYAGNKRTDAVKEEIWIDTNTFKTGQDRLDLVWFDNDNDNFYS